MLTACTDEVEWPAQIAAGIYAGVDFVVANPGAARVLSLDAAIEAECMKRYEQLIGRLAGFMQIRAPASRRLPASTDEALVAGIVGLVNDHIRIGRTERLRQLRPEMVLLALLPYLGFAEAQHWADVAASRAERTG